MEYLRLCLAVENRGFPGGLVELLRNDLERSVPPVWADGIRIVESPSEADAVLLVLNGDPSDGLRRIFYHAFNWALPVAALSAGEPSSEDSMLAKLRSWESLWVFRSTDEARRAVAEHLSSWLATISRGGLPYPCGDALLESYGRIDPSQIDAPSLDHAVEVVSRRGFVCLSGSISSGKTSMARFLLSMSAREGLNPVELISSDLDTKKVESLLTGPEDCVVLYDLDTLRRFTGIWSAFIWDTALSLMIRATEQRRRLVLASSSPKLEILFGSYGDAHVVLPAPSDCRGWRLEQGQAEYSRLVSLDPLDAAEHVLISMFEPVVSENLFRHTLFELWERLFVIHRRSFPSIGELEERYAASDAARGIAPFRRVVIDGETHFATSDTTRMNAMDGAIAARASRRDPLIHSLSEVLLSSREPRVRKAGFSLAHFYGSLEDDERATLLHAASREGVRQVVPVRRRPGDSEPLRPPLPVRQPRSESHPRRDFSHAVDQVRSEIPARPRPAHRRLSHRRAGLIHARHIVLGACGRSRRAFRPHGRGQVRRGTGPVDGLHRKPVPTDQAG